MAKRYRYSFTQKKEAFQGKWSLGLFIASLLLFAAAVIFSLFFFDKYQFVVGGICLFASLLAIYGFVLGLKSFSQENTTHRTGMIGSILNGVLMIGWFGFYLMGL